jgi:regulator of protease activity HflC (stomatin/prohibitin superfamily)
MELLVTLLAIALFAWLLVWLVSRVAQRTTVYEYQAGLKYVHGKFQGLLDAGSYWHSAMSTRIETVDTRPLHQTVPSQEVLSLDGIAIKASMIATTRIVDPELALHKTQDYMAAVYLELQQALRVVMGDKPIDQILESRHQMGESIQALVADKVKSMGVEVSAVGVKDLTFPGSLKQTFAQVVSARQEGLAALERARGETAALRNLANGAKILENNPTLLRLRTLQALNESSGNTVVIKLDSDGAPAA